MENTVEIPEDVLRAAQKAFDDTTIRSPQGVCIEVAIISHAVLAERERCAKIAENCYTKITSHDQRNDYHIGQDYAARRIVEAIRGQRS